MKTRKCKDCGRLLRKETMAFFHRKVLCSDCFRIKKEGWAK
jgi:hypothetical protein